MQKCMHAPYSSITSRGLLWQIILQGVITCGDANDADAKSLSQIIIKIKSSPCLIAHKSACISSMKETSVQSEAGGKTNACCRLGAMGHHERMHHFLRIPWKREAICFLWKHTQALKNNRGRRMHDFMESCWRKSPLAVNGVISACYVQAIIKTTIFSMSSRCLTQCSPCLLYTDLYWYLHL